VLPFPPAVVFKALTDPRQLAVWSGAGARVGRRVGGRFEMWDGYTTGRIVAWGPPSRLAYTWRQDDWKPQYDNSLVEWSLSRVPGGTRLALRHSLLPTAGEARAHRAGWTKYFLRPMAEYLKRRG
jgi:uncharacterized protein YndB with AHSA1/START domain